MVRGAFANEGYESVSIEVAVYPYPDEAGNVLYEVVRYEPKDFKVRVPLGNRRFTWSLAGVQRVPYRLPEMLARKEHETVYVTEGERDAESLANRGLCATTSALGTNWPWMPQFVEAFRNALRLVVIADCDDPGRKAASERAALLAAVVEDVRMVNLASERSDGYDVSDWLNEGHTVQELEQLVEAAPRVTVGAGTLPSAASANVKPHLTGFVDAQEPAPTVARQTTERHFGAGSGRRRVYSTPLSEIEPVETRYVLYPYVPRGEITWFEGRTKSGKTTVALDIIARMSRGRSFVDGSPLLGTRSIILTCEDSIENTIVPRLLAADANLSFVHVLKLETDDGKNGTPSFAVDLAGIERELLDLNPDLVFIDGTFGLLGVKDGNAYTDAYKAMMPVVQMVRRLGSAAIMVRHVRKMPASALNAGVGSVAYAGMARSTVSFAVDSGDESMRYMAHAGCNVGPTGATWRFRIVDGKPIPDFDRTVGAVSWEGVVSDSADEVMSGKPNRMALEVAKEWLRDRLSGVPSVRSDVVDAATAAGITERTLERARREIGVVSTAGARGRPGTWALPAPPAPSPNDGERRGQPSGAASSNLVGTGVSGAHEHTPQPARQRAASSIGAGSNTANEEYLSEMTGDSARGRL
jgi:hypothetical protein